MKYTNHLGHVVWVDIDQNTEQMIIAFDLPAANLSICVASADVREFIEKISALYEPGPKGKFE